MITMVTLKAGHDVAYFTRGSRAGGCAGAMSYYTASGEPRGRWDGKGARSFDLEGEVDPDVIERLHQRGIGPGGEMLLRPRIPKPVQERDNTATAAFVTEHPRRREFHPRARSSVGGYLRSREHGMVIVPPHVQVLIWPLVLCSQAVSIRCATGCQ